MLRLLAKGAFMALLTALLLAAIAGAVALERFHAAAGPAEERTVVVVSPGEGLRSIARRLADAGVLSSAQLFALGVLLTGDARRLQAGEYDFPPRAPMRDVAGMLVRGEILVRRVTVIEGETSAQAAARLAAAEGLAGTLGGIPDEGSLMPETYFYRRGETRESMVRRMQEAMREALEEAWAGRAGDLPLRTPEEALVLASIIEKETGLPDERARIAAVFVNRLRRGMRLQSDPTVVYGAALEDPEAAGRPLLRRDLEREHPWNTYLITGLPPTPVANPGRESILAAVRPAESDDLYFVADGTGGHAFAETLEEHNRNAARWRTLRDREEGEGEEVEEEEGGE